MNRIYRSTAAIALGWLIGSCGGSDAVVGPPPPPTTATVTMSAGTDALVPAATFQLTATAKSASGDALSRNFAWSTSAPATATVSSNGLVVGVAPGIATITAAVDGKSASATITVLDGGVVSASGATLLARSGAVQIVVPADAVASQTNLTVVASTSAGSDPRVATGTAFDFGPDGTQFKKDISLTIKYDASKLPVGTEEPALKIHLSTTSGWQPLPSSVVDTAHKAVTAQVSHFSTYAIIIPAAVSGIVIRGPPDNPIVAGASSLQVGGSEQLTATLTDSNGQILPDRAVTWTSSQTDVATVTGGGLVTALAPGTSTIGVSAGGVTVGIALTVVPIPVASVGVTIAAASIVAGATTQATATTRAANGDVLSGRSVAWSSSNTAIATVSVDGVVTAVSVGAASITATSEGKSGSATITVTAAPVATITLSPTSVTIVSAGSQQLTATLEDAQHNVLNGRTIDWSTNAPGVATVSSTGLVSAISPGVATITALSEGKTATATVTVTPIPVATVSVSPTSASVAVGSTQQLTATTKDAAGATLTGRTVTWSSGDNAVASVDANGLVTPHAIGLASITATSEGKTGASSITVTAAPVTTVTVSLTPNSITAVGTAQATGVTLDANGAVLTGRPVAWSSSNPAVATVSTQGVVSAVAVGTANIVGTSEGKTGSALLTVTQAPVATVTVSPASATVFQGASDQLTVLLEDAHHNVLTRPVTWTSSTPGVATVSTTGLVTAAAATMGTTTITATSEGQTGTSSITVSQVPVASVSAALSPSTINVGQNAQASATLRDAANNVLTGRIVTWNSDNTTVATVSTSGVVAGLAVGTAHITAANGGQTGSATLTVTAVPVSSVSVSLAASQIQIGQTTQATATTRDANNNVLVGRVIFWSSDNTAAATVSGTGLVTAIGVGSANIVATSEGKNGTAALTVVPVPVASLTLSAPITPVLLGQSQSLTATPKDASGNALTGRTVSWASSNPAILSLSGSNSVSTSTGAAITVTGAGLGTAIITATSESAPSAQTPVITVNQIPVATVTVSPLSASLVLGITPTQQLTAVTKDANGTVLTGRTVTWSSSNNAMATVDAAGLVTAQGAGGPVTITAASETKTGTASITVTVAPVNAVAVNPSSASLVVGITPTQQLTATLTDINANVLTGRGVTWSSSNNGIATVDGSGLVTAVAAGGPVTITATSDTKTGTSSITVAIAPVDTVTVTPSSAGLVLGVTPTRQLTAVTKDGLGHVLTDRTVTWTSSNAAIATVSPTGFVTAVAAGVPVTITATSETKTGTSTITVTLAPVNTVTLSTLTTPVTVGSTQVLTATPKDAGGNTLAGRTVNWVSSNPSVLSVSAASSVSTSSGATVTLTAVSAGTATITATSGTAPSATTPTIAVSPAIAAGPLRVSTLNPRYFADPSGRVIYLTGSHYWKNVQDNSTTNPPPAFDNAAYLDFLQAHNHNFTRLWVWEQSRWTAETSVSNWFSPTLYVRTGPGTGADGGLKFDVTQINPAYLARLRQRVIDAGARGIYVSVMLFDGWSVGTKPGSTASNPWLGHPFNSANNINGINGDTNGDANGMEIQTLSRDTVTALQDTYVRAVVDAVNDLDNVIYEISNESDPSGDAWQYHMINLVHSYEATKPKQHPVGMTAPYPNATNSEVLTSPAEWVSMSGDINNLAVVNGSKVSLSDTDHLCGICGTAAWPWMSLMRGHNTLFMDGYDGSAGVGDPAYNPNNSLWPIVRDYMGYARSYALRMDLAHALPSGSLASSGDCLAVPGSEYLVLLPTGGSVTLNLNGASGSFTVEWFSPRSNLTIIGSSVPGGTTVTLTAPGSFGAGNLAVVYVHR